MTGCGDDGTTGPDAASDATRDAPPGCELPALDAPWLASFLGDTLGQLAAAPRFTSTQRNTARTIIANSFTASGWQPQMHDFPMGRNIYATLPATRNPPRNEIILGAHFDTVMDSRGANDNASGASVVLAVARYLMETPCRSAPVTIVLFDLEESGLFGSRAFAQTKIPQSVRAVHTIDQVAWDQDNDMRFELEVPTPALEAEWRAAANVVGVEIISTNTQGTDHQAFRERGFAAIGLTEEYVGGDTSPHRHLPTDTPSTVDMPYLVLATKLTAQVILTEVSE